MTSASPTAAPELGAFREVPYMGVIFVVVEAMKLGFRNGHPDWSNLGQGQPEVGPMEGAPPRISHVEILPEDHAYGPLEGTPELREKVAAHYNRLYRRKKQPYTAANVAVAQGGRLALTRAAAALGAVNVGYQVPDYTAYEDMLGYHTSRLHAVPLRTSPENGFRLDPARFRRFAEEQGLSAFLFSNPCNPTGRTVQGEDLQALVRHCVEAGVTLLSDEFYSHFVYTSTGKPGKGPVSAAPYVEEIERDPILLFDGLTKSYRYPGWRVGWVVGPEAMVQSIARTASALDGGPSRIAQRAALQVLAPEYADQETRALRTVFAKKRNELLKRLTKLGVRFPHPSDSTFYAWGCLEDLPAPLNDAMSFFRLALDKKVLTVPGQFFDVNPGGLRKGPSPYRNWMRFSFGPAWDNLQQGLSRLEELVREVRGTASARPKKAASKS